MSRRVTFAATMVGFYEVDLDDPRYDGAVDAQEAAAMDAERDPGELFRRSRELIFEVGPVGRVPEARS